jgi:hypothetical protein
MDEARERLLGVSIGGTWCSLLQGYWLNNSCFHIFAPDHVALHTFVVREVMAGRLRRLWASRTNRFRKALLEHGMGIADQEAPCALGQLVAHTCFLALGRQMTR